jgi:hypothetical protein
MFPRDRAQESAWDCGNLHVQIGPTSCKRTVPIQHGRNIGPTWGQRRPAPNLDQLAPASAQLAPNLDIFGSNLAQVEAHMGLDWKT